MRKIFTSEINEAAFRKEGFVVADFLSLEEADEFKQFYLENDLNLEDAFFTTNSTMDVDYRKKMDGFIKSKTNEKIDSIFVEYETLYASFIIKKRSFKGTIGLHADWQFVQEPEYSALNIWIALSDLNKNSGTLKVVPGSHNKVNQLRGPNYKLDDGLYKFQKSLKTIPLKKGQAIIYDARLLHASSNNLLKNKRIAASALVVPKEASVWYHYFDVANTTKPVKSIEVDKSFYLEKCNFKAVNGIWEEAKSNRKD